MTPKILAPAAIALAWCWLPSLALGHGIVGNRFFPPTIATDDPFPVDELALPAVSYMKHEGPPSREVDTGFEVDKEIFPRFALGISDTYVSQKGLRNSPSAYGWSNLHLNAKYELFQDDEHEAIVSVGVGADVGRTGGRDTSDTFSTISPTLYAAKGLGDLPDNLWALQPFAIQGEVAQNFPVSGARSNTLTWGIALEYSLPYLQQHVRDIGLGAPFKNLIPIVEFSMSTVENRDGKGTTTGTINPGVFYVTDYYEVGIEANVPVNGATGPHVGATVQVWIFIDDIFPRTFGHPLFFGGDQ